MALVVATEILRQLGGRKFQVMTGAKALVGGPDFLTFRLPCRFALDGINRITVTLRPSDTYDIVFARQRGRSVVPVVEHKDVYGYQLRPLFRTVTGLDTSL